VARVWLGRHWLPQAIPRGAVRPGAVWTGMWPRRGRPSRSGSLRIGCVYARMRSPVHNTTRASHHEPRCLTKCPGERDGGAGRPRRRRAPRRLGDRTKRGNRKEPPRLLGSKGRKTGVVTVV
jgi:hypothetical protein